VDRLDGVDWRIDYLLSSSAAQELNMPSVQLQLKVKPSTSTTIQTHSFDMSAEKFRVLLNGSSSSLLIITSLELKSARDAMDALNLTS
jgi:hypothetical protein